MRSLNDLGRTHSHRSILHDSLIVYTGHIMCKKQDVFEHKLQRQPLPAAAGYTAEITRHVAGHAERSLIVVPCS